MGIFAYIIKDLDTKKLTQTAYTDRNSHNCICSATYLQENTDSIYGLEIFEDILLQTKYLAPLKGQQRLQTGRLQPDFFVGSTETEQTGKKVMEEIVEINDIYTTTEYTIEKKVFGL